jgi:hypothetical protein
MTNPFLKAEVEAAIEKIQYNIDEVEPCLKLRQPHSPLLAEYLHHQKDVIRTLKGGPRCDANSGHP